MTQIVTILTQGFADWETALLNAVARSFYGVETLHATPDGESVTSSGGMRIVADLAIADIDIGALDALVVCGGAAWQADEPPDIAPQLRAARAAGKVIGLICDGTVAGARAGLLDEVAHTSNGVGYLAFTGYAGAARYSDVPEAVADGPIVTAAGTAPVSFMVEVMRGLDLADDNLAYYVGLHRAQHGAAA
ncbi:MAG: DJ-1/PfpI family protein [Devosia sp.]|nr:DJ-1/PfpI family protein [Devosia sp.]